MSIVDAVTDGMFDDTDPDRCRDILLRVHSPNYSRAAGDPAGRRADGAFARGEH